MPAEDLNRFLEDQKMDLEEKLLYYLKEEIERLSVHLTIAISMRSFKDKQFDSDLKFIYMKLIELMNQLDFYQLFNDIKIVKEDE